MIYYKSQDILLIGPRYRLLSRMGPSKNGSKLEDWRCVQRQQFQGQGHNIFVLEISSRSTTVLEDPIPGKKIALCEGRLVVQQ